MKKHEITILDFYIGIAIITIANILTVIDAGPFDCQQLFDIYPVKARVLFVAWWMFIICGTAKVILVLKKLNNLFHDCHSKKH